MKQEDPNQLRHNGTDALTELEAATKNVAAALEKSVSEYKELMEKYQDLQETVNNGAADAQANSEPGGYQRHVVVMIDAYDNELTDLFFRYAKESIANQKYTLEDAVDDWFRKYRPDLEHVHRIVQIYADYGVLLAGTAQSGNIQDVGAQQPSAKLLSTSGAYFDFINVTSEEDLIRKMQGLVSNHIRDVACISFLFSTDRCSHLSAPGEYSVKTKDISTEFAILLSDLAEGKLPSWTPACSRGNIEQVREMTGNDTVATENETAHRKESYSCFENNQYVARTSPKSDMKSLNIPITSNSSLNSSTVIPAKPRTGFIPINAAGQRLDPTLRTPSNAEFSAYKLRTGPKKLCSVHYLKGRCWAKKCCYDHSPINDSLSLVLKHKLLENPCRFEGVCRDEGCIYGHVCARKGCAGQNDKGCKFSAATHGVDMKVTGWARPIENKKGANKEKAVRVMTPTDTGSSKSSMENWPSMGNLIDI